MIATAKHIEVCMVHNTNHHARPQAQHVKYLEVCMNNHHTRPQTHATVMSTYDA